MRYSTGSIPVAVAIRRFGGQVDVPLPCAAVIDAPS